ncbi:MAG: PAS domain-containing protein [Pseudomonadota bacterium]
MSPDALTIHSVDEATTVRATESCELPKGMRNQRRLVWRLLTYWEQRRGERDFPMLADIDPEEIQEMWPQCFVLDVANFRDLPYFHYLGPSLARYSGVFLSGQDWAMTLLRKAVWHYREVLERSAPILVEEELTQFDHQKLLFRSVMLPLSDDQETINYVLGAANGIVRRD